MSFVSTPAHVCRQHSLNDDYIPPNAVKFSVLFINSNLTEAARHDQLSAGVIFDEDAGDELVEAGPFGCGDESLHRMLSGASPA